MFGQVESFKVFDLRIVSCLIELRAVTIKQLTILKIKHLEALNLTKHLTILLANTIQL